MYCADCNSALITIESLAGPDVMRIGSVYYLYATAEIADHCNVFTSADGLTWSKGPVVFSQNTDTLWAPNVFYDPVSQRFYLYYSSDFNLGVAVSDLPESPFIDQGILVEDAIDAHVYFEDGDFFLYYASADEGFKSLEQMGKRMLEGMVDSFFGQQDTRVRKRIYVQRLHSPTEIDGERIELIEATEDWELGYSLHVVEGPWVFKNGATYYLMYSGSPSHESEYGIGYATADNPMGPFQKSSDNPILRSASDPSLFGKRVYGPGHNSVVTAQDGRRWVYFHQNEQRFNLGLSHRFVTRGELKIDRGGKLEIKLND